MSLAYASLAGTWQCPRIDVRVPSYACTPDGQPVTDWLLSRGARADRTGVWTIHTGWPTMRADLAACGLPVTRPDGQPVTTTDLGVPAMTRSDRTGQVLLWPRMAPIDTFRQYVGDDATFETNYVRVPDTQLRALRDLGVIDLTDGYQPVAHHDVEPLLFDGTIEGLRAAPVTDLDVVTPELAVSMSEAGMTSLFDLLHVVPLRYLDRSNPVSVDVSMVGTTVSFIAQITSIKTPPPGNRGMTTIRVVDSGSGTAVSCAWFNASWVARKFAKGDRVLVYGKLDEWTSPRGNVVLQIRNPLMDTLPESDAFDPHAAIIGIYPATRKVTTWAMRRAAKEAATRLSGLVDPVPASVLDERGLMPRFEAVRGLHVPTSLDVADRARTRLAYDELLRWQLVLAQSRANADAAPAISHAIDGSLSDTMIAGLPYTLTGEQAKVIDQVRADMASDHAMSRLLQGEVGAGKTTVAHWAALACVESGHTAAIMAPTTVLAQQHYQQLVDACQDMRRPDGKPLNIVLLLSRTKRKRVLDDLAAGNVDIVVGTQSLLSVDVAIKGLGLVVIDEQHRFGVEQRGELSRRAEADGVRPDVLVMTATPAPRTAVLTVFGDLDVSTIKQLPPGRQPVATRVARDIDTAESSVWADVRDQVAQGRQAYVVVPLVSDSEAKSARGAQTMADMLSSRLLQGLRVGVVTGKQPVAEREATMLSFSAGNLDVLVATTVIEVGVNVPNATVMVITGAESFGISQLHQIRGRAGRGKHPGVCYLVPSGDLGDADAARLDALVESNDGFVLAQRDLEIRGPGSLSSVKQSGRAADLRIAKLTTDMPLVEAAREDARMLIAGDPDLSRHPMLRAEIAWVGQNLTTV